MSSKLEDKFALLWRAMKGPPLVAEHKFHPTRRWRFDFAEPARKVAVEIEGGIWNGGRHTRGSGYEKDAEKYNTATEMGWRVFRLTGGMVNGEWVERIIKATKEN